MTSERGPISPHPWQRAASLAAEAHRHQLRNDRRTPYAAHTTRVALIVTTVFNCTDPDIIAAALLHDIIEDTTVDYDDLLEQFNRRTADLVAGMSKDHRMEEAPREVAYERQLADAPWEVRLLKLADVYDNLSDAATETAQRKFIDKAQTALDLAANDPQLNDASQAVQDLITQVEEQLSR